MDLLCRIDGKRGHISDRNLAVEGGVFAKVNLHLKTSMASGLLFEGDRRFKILCSRALYPYQNHPLELRAALSLSGVCNNLLGFKLRLGIVRSSAANLCPQVRVANMRNPLACNRREVHLKHLVYRRIPANK